MKHAPPRDMQRLILIGGGHAHLQLISRIPALVSQNVEVTIIDGQSELFYSGMMPAVVGGLVTLDAARIPIAAEVRRRGGRFVQAPATKIDPERRVVATERGEFGWDVASIAIGSRVQPPVPVAPEAVTFSAKPVGRLPELVSTVMDMLRSHRGRPVRVVFIGGGASAVELSGNLLEGIRRRNPRWSERLEVTIVTRGASLIPKMPPVVQEICYESLTRRGVRIRSEMTPRGVSATAVEVEGATSLPADVSVFCTGLSAPSVISSSGLPHQDSGELVVSDALRMTEAPIYGGGDCIAIEELQLDKIGVHAVRQGEILAHNVIRELLNGTDTAIQRYVPPDAPLLILNLGDGTGILVKGTRVIHGRIPYRLKERIDWAFVRSRGTRIRPALQGPPRPGLPR
ncbi:MAG: NAD(P)/FAD-dependent oxidoreductase [Alkalispirochaeta sp.]